MGVVSVNSARPPMIPWLQPTSHAVHAQNRTALGKDQTHGIERDHARQRHWLARFRRRSIVVSKAERMVHASIALFAAFGGNDKLQDLLSMLA